MVTACVDKKDCDAILGDIGGVVGSCTEVAIESLAPLGSAQAFCEAFGGIATTCGKVVDRAQCLRLTRLNNDKVLNQARQCTTKPCSDVVPCIEATLALDLGTSESGGGSGSGSGTGSGSGGGGTGSGSGGGGAGSGSGGGGTSNAMCNGNTASSAVSQCLFSKCCSQWSACENDPNCNQLFVCLANCPSGDNVCRDGCGAMYGAGIGALNSLFDCWDANACSSSSGSGTGGGQSG